MRKPKGRQPRPASPSPSPPASAAAAAAAAASSSSAAAGASPMISSYVALSMEGPIHFRFLALYLKGALPCLQERAMGETRKGKETGSKRTNCV